MQPLKVLKESSSGQIDSTHSAVSHQDNSDRVKDFGVTQNGIIALNEKGEVMLVHSLAHSQQYQLANKDSGSVLQHLFKKIADSSGSALNIQDHEQEEHKAQPLNHNSSFDDIDVSVHLGDQFDTEHQRERQEYFQEFDQLFVSRQLL